MASRKNTPKPEIASELVEAGSQAVRTFAHGDSATSSGAVRTFGHAQFTEQDASAARAIGVVFEGDTTARLARAAVAANEAALRAVEAGYLLMHVHAEVAAQGGDFAAALEQIGMQRQRAYEFISMARFASAVPDDQRAQLLALPKTKVLALAAAEPTVIEALVEDGDIGELGGLSVRDLRARIKELEAKTTDLAVERDTAQAKAEKAEKKLAGRSQAQRDDAVPVVIADLRHELGELKAKAELALRDFQPLGVELVTLRGNQEAWEWVAQTARIALAGLVAIKLQAEGVIAQYMDAFGLDKRDMREAPDVTYGLTPTELVEHARQWDALMQTHAYEAALREWDRGQKKPKGKGRPEAKPVPPKGAA